MVALVASDNEQFVVDWDVFCKMGMFSPHPESPPSTDEPIPLPNVSSSVLKKVLTWCEYHKNDPSTQGSSNESEDPRKRQVSEPGEWDTNFISVDQEMLFEIILAANYLDIKGLLDLGCKTVAQIVKGKTPEEIRKLFNIVNDFTPEEEACDDYESEPNQANDYCYLGTNQPVERMG